MWNCSDYTIQFSFNPFYLHEQDILTAGECPGFLPMSFLRTGHGLVVHYGTSGYQPLSNYRIERSEDALYLMERTIMILHQAPEYLLAPERLRICTDTVFYGRDTDDLRLAFLPKTIYPPVTPKSAPPQPALPTASPVACRQQPQARANPARQGTSTLSRSMSLLQREVILFLAQLKQDINDGKLTYIAHLAQRLAYGCRSTSDMLRVTGLLRRELDERTGMTA